MKTDIYFKNIKCGVLEKKGDESFEFSYTPEYVDSQGSFISISLPLAKDVYKSQSLFSFFDGLIPEGWLLNLAQKELRLNINKDKYELLKALCQQSIGAVHVGNATKEKYSFKSGTTQKKRQFKKCLVCYENFLHDDHNHVYHYKCMKKIFSKEIVPYVEFDQEKIEGLVKISLNNHKTITGVQKKLSLDLSENEKGGKNDRLTLVDLWGKFILKPRGNAPHYPENEHLCLRMAEVMGIETEKCALIPLLDGSLCFIARRFDRGSKDEEFHQEDFCQITGSTTGQKYTGSYEQIGRYLKQYSSVPGNDLYRLFQYVIFNFVIGNVDLHKKNLSLCYENEKGKKIFLSPAYDVLSTDLYIEDDEQLALAINGKKNKLKMKDFYSFANSLGISIKVFKNIIEDIYKILPAWIELIEASFLEDNDKEKFKKIVLFKLEFFNFSED